LLFFGTLILHGDTTDIWKVMNVCVIIHNMIIKSESAPVIDDQPYELQGPLVPIDHEVSVKFHTFL
jgi:hypothetical protein